MKPQGLGTERIEEELAELFPTARVARMDLDTTRKKTAHAKLLDAFANLEYDILWAPKWSAKASILRTLDSWASCRPTAC